MTNKIALIAAALVLTLFGLLIISGKFLGPPEKLNKDIASQAMVLSYAESGQEISNVVRVAVKKNSDLIPLRLEVLSDKGAAIKDFNLVKAENQWICMNPEDANHDMKGFETEKFVLNTFNPEKAIVKITFQDKNGKTFYSNYPVSDTCTKFLNNSKQLK